MVNQPRGIRNNNPGNVEYNPRTLWNGLAKPPTDGRFCIFLQPQFGLRVISKLLVAYQEYHDCHCVEDFIHRWAPPVENDTNAYVLAVARACSIDPKARIDIHDVHVRAKMLYGIVMHENGIQPYPMDLLLSACEMA